MQALADATGLSGTSLATLPLQIDTTKNRETALREEGSIAAGHHAIATRQRAGLTAATAGRPTLVRERTERDF